MKRSDGRILTTHTGSLPRAKDMLELMVNAQEDRDAQAEAIDARARTAVADVVRKQVEAGLDVVSDGEQSKPSYATYVKDRLTGFDGEERTQETPQSDQAPFPGYRPVQFGTPTAVRPTCSGPIAWRDFDAVEKDIKSFKAATDGAKIEEPFMTAASPGVIARFLENRYYPSHEAYLWALAEVMKDEYEAIANAGFVVQIDCPDLASARTTIFQHLTNEEFVRVVVQHLEVVSYATAKVPEEQLRLHLCWGNREGPHHHDIPLREIIEPVLATRATGISFPAANPRHAHEWKIWEEIKLPADMVLLPGFIDTTTNFIEHPELVAQRIVQYAGVVGRERVIASSDCGMSTFAGGSRVDGDISWAKLGALVEGARLASSELW